MTGKIKEVLFNTQGRFDGFVLSCCACDEEVCFDLCDDNLRGTIMEAWEGSLILRVSVCVDGDDDGEEGRGTIMRLGFKNY